MRSIVLYPSVEGQQQSRSGWVRNGMNEDERSLRRAVGGIWQRVGALPGPGSGDFHFQRPTEKGPHENNEGEDANTLKGWVYCHRADDVRRHEQF